MNSNKTGLQLLPDEMLIKIFNYMDTYDLVRFCKVYKEYEYFFSEKQLIRDVNFARKFQNGLHEFEYFSRKTIHEYVTSLNINGLYWAPVADLRKIVVKLINLQSLLAVDTNLGVTDKDITAYRATKLTKLALTLEGEGDISNCNLPFIKSLCVIIVKKKLSSLLLEKLFPDVVNLWIYLPAVESGIRMNFLNLKLNRFIAQTWFPNVERAMYGITRYFRRSGNRQLTLDCYENIPKLYDEKDIIIFGADEATQNAWKMLGELHSEIIYGPKDTRRLYFGLAQPKTILFEELNLIHKYCSQRYGNACQQILQSSNISKLRKLAMMSCHFPTVDWQEPESTPCDFKRRRVGWNAKAAISGEEEAYRNIFKHFPNLQELEVFFCNQRKPSFIHSMDFIKDLRCLHSLTVEIPVFSDGKFLIDIAINCKQLVSLRVLSKPQNEALNYNLQIALTHATALKDIRLENYRLQMEKLFSCFGSVHLERLVLFSIESDNKLNDTILHDFFRNHPNLVFMFIVIREATDAFIKTIQRFLFTYKKGNPQKLFLIRKHCVDVGDYRIPLVHYREMMLDHSKVCSLNFYNDFNVLM